MLSQIGQRAGELIGRESRLIRHLRKAYETFEGWSTHGQGVPFRINGAQFRRNQYQRNRFPDNFAYEVEVAAYLSERVKPGDIALDVGANVGYYVLQLSHWSGPNGRIIAFEPNPGPCAILTQVVQVNHLESRVIVVPSAIGATTTTATLHVPRDDRLALDGISRLGSSAKELGSETSTIEVPVTTIDDYCENACLTPDWIIIDIEGFELAALFGARRLIERRRSKIGLVVEMHPDLWPSPSGKVCALSILKHLRLEPIPLTGQKDAFAERGVVALEPY
jgi:FkbM family methyltransferase